MRQGALSVILEIPEDAKALVLSVIQSSKIPFAQIPSIHFARIVLLDEGNYCDGTPYPARLVFATTFDKPLPTHIEQLIEKAGPQLWQIFSFSVNFPVGQPYTPENMMRYLRSVMIRANTFYVGVGPRSVTQIHDENILRSAIETFLDSHAQELNGKDAIFIRRKIIEFVESSPDLRWARTPASYPSVLWKSAFYAKLIGVILLVVALLPIVIPTVIIFLAIILVSEIKEKPISNPIDKAHVRALLNSETGPVQNPFSAYGEVKPGTVRRMTMLFLLKMTDFLAPYIFSKGRLSGIPTVHFARWIVYERHMLFLSNFDGRTEGYLHDFINIAAKHLTLMFCHTIGYPRTRLMIFGGAKDAAGFMEWARAKQVVTNVWYNANPSLTVNNIYTNSQIRNGLYGRMSGRKSRKWLKTF